jgi:hypothetical protein
MRRMTRTILAVAVTFFTATTDAPAADTALVMTGGAGAKASLTVAELKPLGAKTVEVTDPHGGGRSA